MVRPVLCTVSGYVVSGIEYSIEVCRDGSYPWALVPDRAPVYALVGY